MAVPLAGALLGFLFYNFNPATVFLGDSGALTIGFLLGCYGLVWTEQGTGLLGTLVPLLALVIPLTDLSLSIVRRSLRGQPIFSADRGHLHHKLLDRGLSVRRSALTLYAIAMVATAFPVMISYPAARVFHVLVVLGFCIAGGAGIHYLRYPEFEVAGMLIFRGELRRAFQKNLRLEQLTIALERTKNEEEWWKTVADAAREEPWVRLTWSGRQPPREIVLSPGEPHWSFQIALGEGEAIQVEGAAMESTGATVRPALDLIGFSQVLRRTLAARREHPALL
jgi:UDP-GlcNAc:undecaprenyl-phosphate GlcNAc-1-phosphate transferase